MYSCDRDQTGRCKSYRTTLIRFRFCFKKTTHNANGVAEQLEVFLPQDQPEGLIADVVVANILAGPLRDLSGIIKVLH